MVRFGRGNSLERFIRRVRSFERSSSSSEFEMYEMEGRQSPGPQYDGSGNSSWSINKSERAPRSRFASNASQQDGAPSDLQLMKEKFAKLLLGEDMSGSGKGVSSALALSNAITNLSASVFGEHRKLEPLPPEKRARWRKEVDWLLAVTDHIVEFVPTEQVKDGHSMEVMSTQQRRDLHMNIPALRKLDAMLLSYLENFKDQQEFWYASGNDSVKGMEARKDDKWWMPTVKVPPSGLSIVSRKWLEYQRESVNQVLKAAMAINAIVLAEMEIPEAYMEALPKNGRVSLGDALYKNITDEYFDPIKFLELLDLSTEHKVVDLKNRIEASCIIWKRKMTNKDMRSSWGSMGSIVSLEKREQFEERAETILHLLKQQYPGAPQSHLDISKIQYNKDVGYAILESYARVLESLAFSVMSRIEDVLHADNVARNPSLKDSNRKNNSDTTTGAVKLDPRVELEKLKGAPTSMTLWDFMGWQPDELEMKSKDADNFDDSLIKKPHVVAAPKKFSYIEKVETGLRSPTARH
ncbi:rho guanine nucleotide exchange factor 8-like protein [Carex littledalei]|uniref:Rho guanine nucleotide exchange factor 8-like protein n=1 Tax=Carex littledalei TaxID=544730 RepID=A0A833VBZ0_9POAL|nr:rho guanine nucleotide exchange factor 8-like protein [Carex littledalei]